MEQEVLQEQAIQPAAEEGGKWYKKWWIWLIVAVIVIAIGVGIYLWLG